MMIFIDAWIGRIASGFAIRPILSAGPASLHAGHRQSLPLLDGGMISQTASITVGIQCTEIAVLLVLANDRPDQQDEDCYENSNGD